MPTSTPSSVTTGNTGCDDRSTTARALVTVDLARTVMKSVPTAGSINCADLSRIVVLTVSNGLKITDTFLARASSIIPAESENPPVITSTRTPCSMAGN